MVRCDTGDDFRPIVWSMPTDAYSRGCARCDRVPTNARVKMMASGQSRAGLRKQRGRLHLNSASAPPNGWFDSSGRHISASQALDEHIDTLNIDNVEGIRREAQISRHSRRLRSATGEPRGNLLEGIQRLEKRLELS